MQNFEKIDMSTMTSCTASLTKEGFTENFIVTEKGIEAPSNQKTYIPDEVKIVSFYRFEGETDPADSAILYAVETNDGVKGMLIDSYGSPYVSQKVSTFIREVEDISKRGHTDTNTDKQDPDSNRTESKEKAGTTTSPDVSKEEKEADKGQSDG